MDVKKDIDSGTSFKDKSKDRLKLLETFKRNRDSRSVEKALEKLVYTAKSGENLMPKIINCVEKNCTLGEIIFALKNVFGEYLE